MVVIITHKKNSVKSSILNATMKFFNATMKFDDISSPSRFRFTLYLFLLKYDILAGKEHGR